MDKDILLKAQTYLDKVDFIVDLFDNTYIWGSPEALKATEYTLEEFTNLKNFDLLEEGVKPEKYRLEISNYLQKKKGITTIFLKSKTGKRMRGEIEYQVFELKGGFYMAAKGIKIETLP